MGGFIMTVFSYKLNQGKRRVCFLLVFFFAVAVAVAKPKVQNICSGFQRKRKTREKASN